MRNSKSLIVIGGGAAGFFCAVNAARMNPDLRVMIVEKSDKVLSKVKISGGGRCNVTHACFELNQFFQYYPRGAQFLKKCFHWFNAKHTVEWFKERHVNLIAEPDGRMFSDTNTSQTIIDCLLGEAKRYEVNLLLKTNIIKILPVKNYFKLTAVNGKEMVADYVCITTGGFPNPRHSRFVFYNYNLSCVQPRLKGLIIYLNQKVINKYNKALHHQHFALLPVCRLIRL